jgi:hypothetical protein
MVKEMDYGDMIGESFAYAKEAVVGKWNKWLMLVIATILLGIPLMGYVMKVLRDEKPAPEVDNWGTLFVDGIKYLVVAFIYTIPLFIVGIFVLGAGAAAMISGNPSAMMAAFGAMAVGLMIMLIIGIFIAIFEIIGVVRLARTGNIGEAFNFNAILATINKLGWGPYLIAIALLFIIGFIMGVISNVLMIIPVLGAIIYLCLIAPFTLFIARFICQLYDSAGGA